MMDDKKNQNTGAEEINLEDMEKVSGGGNLQSKTAKTETQELTKDTEENV